MNLRHSLNLSVIIVLGLALLPGSAVSQEKSIKDKLVGTWNQVSTIVTSKDGKKLEPFGSKPTGLLIFTPEGNVALINTRSDIPKIASNNRLQGTPEEYAAIVRGTHAFFGTYNVDEAAKSFTVNIVGGTFPNEVGGTSTRTVTGITDDELKFTYPAGAAAGAVAEQSWTRGK
jgi:hypothetical protein